MSLGDAVPREVAWLNSFGDGLPALIDPDGPWQNIQTWRPRVAATRTRAVYVTESNIHVARFANIRSMGSHDFRLKLIWPLSSGIGSAEEDYASFMSATAQLITRILGPIGDKTHGGRFLSVAEEPKFLDAELDDPDTTIGPQAGFTGVVTYSADDFEYPN